MGITDPARNRRTVSLCEHSEIAWENGAYAFRICALGSRSDRRSWSPECRGGSPRDGSIPIADAPVDDDRTVPDSAGTAASRSVVRYASAGGAGRCWVHDRRRERALACNEDDATADVEQTDSRRDSTSDCRRCGRAADPGPCQWRAAHPAWSAHSARQ